MLSSGLRDRFVASNFEHRQDVAARGRADVFRRDECLNHHLQHSKHAIDGEFFPLFNRLQCGLCSTPQGFLRHFNSERLAPPQEAWLGADVIEE